MRLFVARQRVSTSPTSVIVPPHSPFGRPGAKSSNRANLLIQLLRHGNARSADIMEIWLTFRNEAAQRLTLCHNPQSEVLCTRVSLPEESLAKAKGKQAGAIVKLRIGGQAFDPKAAAAADAKDEDGDALSSSKLFAPASAPKHCAHLLK